MSKATDGELEAFRRGWTLGYTQGQYNMRRTLLRKVAVLVDPLECVTAIERWLEEWPKKRRKSVMP